MKTSWWCLCTVVLAFIIIGYSQEKNVLAAGNSSQWVDISAKVIQNLTREGKKIGYPGKTAGITADRITADMFAFSTKILRI